MNKEYERLQQLIKKAEECAFNTQECLYRLGFHLMPPTGWLNDPNGLCKLKDTYHIFFQYSPLHVNGGMKAWGHYTTKDFCHYKYCGAPFVPDETYDADGVFSGSALVDEKGMHIFYTGNVELPGDYDYTTAGRRADTILVESKDGEKFTEKKVVIDTDEYPNSYSCHIRDPKVWKENDTYYMVLGGRTIEDKGKILVYTSKSMCNWKFIKELTTKNNFAYMWECPDLFLLDDQYVLSFSPQGLEREEYRYQNIYHAGYFLTRENPIVDEISYIADTFQEWDMGFDFYAPQTFADDMGRRILIGWCGVPYAEYSNGEVEEGWQHCLTVPRELSIHYSENYRVERVFQYPIKEINNLRKKNMLPVCNNVLDTDEEYLDIICNNLSGPFHINIAKSIELIWNGEELKLSLSKEAGRGRTVRKCKADKVSSLRILLDSSIVECYVNSGEIVFTTRYYKSKKGSKVEFNCGDASLMVYPMEAFTIE